MDEHEGIIDVWSVETFDDELRGDLEPSILRCNPIP